ncbi:hypothetical protein TraAM80_07609 [Trypanosoma rangeli]|uniref:Uncharacterized protein n=1 Tax=Trypanosoma rangeli TaxID=5698 RepID=A0A3R7N5M0_TRYRA|nr:uncharacterized protein TraAM80_07609 [Trypanosoma rangeli]RNF00601.1 hypothetical protein TraAM80_07609 [Trypanosoma rangeli]|eukprot:RNF00601.1 hypothetical protein TraAM80_07609 [Trypanosoma rangeli]
MMQDADVGLVPRRNPFKTQWRTNLPSFHECLASLGSRENFRSFGEVLAAVSPTPREVVETSCALTSPKMNRNADFSFLTLEVSDITMPGTPPQPVERYQQSCASSTERTPRRTNDEERGREISLTPPQLPPLCPNASPIAHSPSALGNSCSVPRTEPQEVLPTHSAERTASALLEERKDVGAVFTAEIPNAPIDHSARFERVTAFMPCENFISENNNIVGEWGYINQRVDSIIPPLCEWRDGDWFSDTVNSYGDFAYHHPLLYQATADTTREARLRRHTFL